MGFLDGALTAASGVAQGYIPLQGIFGGDSDKPYDRGTKAKMLLEVLNPVKIPYAIKGISQFVLQHNPETIPVGTATAKYASHLALGMSTPTLQYTGSSTDSFPVVFHVTDSYDGPPLARVDNDGIPVPNGFQTLYNVVDWFQSLTHPIAEWRQPPYVRLTYGGWSDFGVVTEVSANHMSFHKNGDPLLTQITMTVQPDSLFIFDQRDFYDVKEGQGGTGA